MKRIALFLTVIFMSGFTFSQINLSFLKSKGQKGEKAGVILKFNNEKEKYLIIGTDTLFMTEKYIPKANYSEGARVHAFYKVNPANSRKEIYYIYFEKLYETSLIFCLPVLDDIIYNAATNNLWEEYPVYKEKYGNISTIGYGLNMNYNVYPGVKLLLETMIYNYNQEICEPGEDIRSHGIYGGRILMPLGLRYITNTSTIRLGATYSFMRDKMIQPFVGFTYGINIWNLNYSSWDEKKVYGKANGATFRHTLRGGVNVLFNGLTLSAYFDQVAPVASYSMENLFGIGETYSQPDGMIYPISKFNIALIF